MEIDVLRSELERLFEPDELLQWSRVILAVDPEQLGAHAEDSFAGALVTHCLESDALEALCDALLASKPGVDPRIDELRAHEFEIDEALAPGTEIGEYVVGDKLGEGPASISYSARRGERRVRLKVLRRAASRDARGLNRYLTLTRLAAQVLQDALPTRIEVGRAGLSFFVAHDYVECISLASRLREKGPMPIDEAREVLEALVKALAALHEQRLTHGNLKSENVLLGVGPADPRVLLVDAGRDRVRHPSSSRRIDLLSASSPAIVAPERLRGEDPGHLSDLYSFGALMFHVLTAKPVFETRDAVDAVVAHLQHEPPRPSSLAPPGWISEDVDRFVSSLLQKDPSRRPPSAAAVLEMLNGAFAPRSVALEQSFAEEELTARIDEVLTNPENDEAALALEALATTGAHAARIADAFMMAAETAGADSDEARNKIRKDLLHRAARMYQDASAPESAERAYTAILAIDPGDETAAEKLQEVRRHLGKYEDLVEALVQKAERAEPGPVRARTLAEIGELYLVDLDDPEQATIAFTQAFCEDPQSHEYAERIEQLARDRKDSWEEILGTCTEASIQERPAESRNALLRCMGRWYVRRFPRPDLALSCFRAVLTSDPADDAALEGLETVYANAHQWSDLARTLLQRADVSRDDAKTRDLRCAAAEVFEDRLDDIATARSLYAGILALDPSHPTAAKALGRIYERTADWSGHAALLDRQAEASSGQERHRLMCRAAEIHEGRSGDDGEAVRRYSAVLAEEPTHTDALKGLERLYGKLGRFRELLENLRSQVRLSATPRQKIALLERIARIYDEEFLDHERAAEALEEIVVLDAEHHGALAALTRHYRALSRWERLAAILEHRARRESDPRHRLDLTLARAHVIADELGAIDAAIEAYEKVLQLDDRHEQALEALARLREKAGQQDAAVAAIRTLADKAESREAKAEHHLRAAKLLESRGDSVRAIEQYALAFDACPSHPATGEALRTAYIERGDVHAAIGVLERQLENAPGDAQKARLSAEMASLYRRGIADTSKAERAAKRALSYDPTNAGALTILGDLAFESRHFMEAASHYEKIVARVDHLSREDAVHLLVRYTDALEMAGAAERAVSTMNALHRLAPEDPKAVQRVAAFAFDHGSPGRAVELYSILSERFGDRLGAGDKALAAYRLGEATRRGGDIDRAIDILERAADLDPSSALPLEALAEAYRGRKDFRKLVETKTRHLDLVDGDARFELLVDIGELAANELQDRNLAAKSFVAALDERPADRKLLIRLMQLYSAEREWTKLIEIVVKLADFVDDRKQRAKYLQTAAAVASGELGDHDRALDFHAKVLEVDPTNEKSLDESIELSKLKQDYASAVELLKQKAKRAGAAKQTARMLAAFNELGVLYKDRLGRIGHAIDAYEAAQTLEPNDRTRNELLANLYASNPEKYLDKAVAAQMTMLRRNPFREESYQLLRRLYTNVRRADPAWCLCQALYVLKLADPEEERFFRRMRSEHPAYAQAVVTEHHWLDHLLHADADAALTSVFALVEPAIIATRSESFEALGYDTRLAVDAADHPYEIGRTLHYAAGVMGMALPPVFENVNDPAGLSFLHSSSPAVVMGADALRADVSPQAAAFASARHLAYYRPGLYTRYLLATPTALRAWLFAAIRMNAPQFPVAMDIEGPVLEATAGLEEHLNVQTRDHLARVVSKLLQSGRSLDLKKWVNGVDFTADRAGFLLCHDLETAVEIIRSSDDGSASVGSQQRLKELVLFAISESYFELRADLGITIDS